MAQVAADDWRLFGQQRYLQGVALKRISWTPRHLDNDHDHCEFCTIKLASADIPDSIQEGYCTQDLYHWVCAECFHDFKEQFQWVLVD